MSRKYVDTANAPNMATTMAKNVRMGIVKMQNPITLCLKVKDIHTASPGSPYLINNNLLFIKLSKDGV